LKWCVGLDLVCLLFVWFWLDWFWLDEVGVKRESDAAINMKWDD